MFGEHVAQARLENAIARHHAVSSSTMEKQDQPDPHGRITIAGTGHTIVFGDHTTVIVPGAPVQLEQYTREHFGRDFASCTAEQRAAARSHVLGCVDS